MMEHLDTLVVGVDGSATSDAALAWAAVRAGGDGVLHVVRATRGPIHLDDDWATAGDAAVTVVTHIVEDDPADALMQVAEREGADAIVVGAHGSGDSRHVLGRVTTKLLHNADVPIFVINPNQTDDGPAAGRIVACVGYGKASDAASAWAADLAVATDRPLTLLHVVTSRPMIPGDSPSDTLASYFGPDVAREWAQADLDGLAAELRRSRPNLVVDTELEIGPQVRSIEEAAQGAELVVLGKRRTNVLARRLIGHRLHHLVVRITAPVAVVPCTVDD